MCMTPNKQIKPSEFSDYFDLLNSHKQIRAIPANYCRWQQKQYDSGFNRTFALRGYKNIPKITAVGHQADVNLKKIKKSCIKMVKSINFDAYLCDNSGLKPFCEVLKKLKGTITCLNLTIRRVDKLSEIEDLSNLFYRLIRLKKLRIEFARTEKIDSKSIEAIARSLQRCASLKILELRLVYIPTLNQADFHKFCKSVARIPNLDEFIYNVQTFYSPQNSYEGVKCQLSNFKRVKKVEIGFGRKTGWTSMNDGAVESIPFLLNSFQKGMNPKEFSLVFNSFPILSEGAQAIANIVPTFDNLRLFRLDLSNCQTDELELMILAEGFTLCKQLKKLYMKHEERSQVPAECLGEFIRIISGLSFLLEFDLFFRKGYKNIHRIAAVGHRADENLTKIKKSCLKTVKSIEFDAYLCDTSALKQFCQVLKKLKGTITCLNITIRRVSRHHDIESLSYLLYRLVSLNKLKLELSSDEKIDGKSIEALARSYRKCYSLKTLETRLVYIPTLGQMHFKKLGDTFAKIPNLEDLAFYVQTFYGPKNNCEDRKLGVSKLKKVKKFKLESGRKTGWTSMIDGEGDFLPFLLNSLQAGINPTEFTKVFYNFPIASEGAEELAKLIPSLENLRIFRLEISNCQIRELELMILAEGFTHCKQLNRLDLKIDERFQVAPECLYGFTKIIASLSFLLIFNIFFRKLKYSDSERLELKEMLSGIENIEYVLTKESFHVYKKNTEQSFDR